MTVSETVKRQHVCFCSVRWCIQGIAVLHHIMYPLRVSVPMRVSVETSVRLYVGAKSNMWWMHVGCSVKEEENNFGGPVTLHRQVRELVTYRF